MTPVEQMIPVVANCAVIPVGGYQSQPFLQEHQPGIMILMLRKRQDCIIMGSPTNAFSAESINSVKSRFMLHQECWNTRSCLRLV